MMSFEFSESSEANNVVGGMCQLPGSDCSTVMTGLYPFHKSGCYGIFHMGKHRAVPGGWNIRLPYYSFGDYQQWFSGC